LFLGLLVLAGIIMAVGAVQASSRSAGLMALFFFSSLSHFPVLMLRTPAAEALVTLSPLFGFFLLPWLRLDRQLSQYPNVWSAAHCGVVLYLMFVFSYSVIGLG
jgi:hypothetical protein